MWLIVFLVFTSISMGHAEQDGKNLPKVPTKGMVTMVDLGSHRCIPCRLMAPILEKLKKEYKGNASIVFIDVFEHREHAQKYRIRAIPTQIFFDKNGKEIYRHIGFMSEEAIVRQLEQMGVRQTQEKKGKKGEGSRGLTQPGQAGTKTGHKARGKGQEAKNL
ncbi:MAG: thioredoxin family protein [Desulfobacterales bacterium]|nr:thioredoxin family protein [Desulfobacterales bacterium]